MRLFDQFLKALAPVKPEARRLIYCEKPSVAKLIARVVEAGTICNGVYTSPRDSVTWGYGYMFSLEYSEPAEIGTVGPLSRWVIKPRREVEEQLANVVRAAAACDELIIATDNDEAGELIGRQLLHYLSWTKPAFRMLLPEMTSIGIAVGLENLQPLEITEEYAARAEVRSRIDCYIARHNGTSGCTPGALGRALLGATTLLVRRAQAIRQHSESTVPHSVLVSADGNHYRATVTRRRMEQTDLAPIRATDLVGMAIHPKLSESEAVSVEPPPLYGLTELMADAADHYGISPQTTHSVAQTLYEAGVITYPRVSDRKYFGGRVGISTRDVPPDDAGADVWRIYSLVALRERVAAMGPARVHMARWEADAGHYVLSWKSVTVVDDGWTESFRSLGIETLLPDMLRVSSPTPTTARYQVAAVHQCPPRFRVGSLLRAMADGTLEVAGKALQVGSDASRADIIPRLIKAGLATEDHEGHVEATTKAVSLISELAPALHGFCLCPELDLPDGVWDNIVTERENATTYLTERYKALRQQGVEK